jgi:uncharacterized protein YndB with AHSA1/START domain
MVDVSRVTAAVDLPHPIEKVFRVATRVPDLPRWLPEVADAELLSPAMAQGSGVRLRMGPNAGGMVISGSVKRYRPPELLELTGKGGPVGFDVRTTLTASGPATTRIALQLEISTPPFLGFIGREAEVRISEAMPGSLARLRALLDAEPD